MREVVTTLEQPGHKAVINGRDAQTIRRLGRGSCRFSSATSVSIRRSVSSISSLFVSFWMNCEATVPVNTAMKPIPSSMSAIR